jgi:lipoate-protein ligase A
VIATGGPAFRPPLASMYGLVRAHGGAAEFHGRAIPSPPAREVWQHELAAPALVLGSAQRDEVVDRDACHRRAIAVVRRRSGGGAVLLVPGEVTWVDVIVPRGALGWSDDVHATMTWLGDRLSSAVHTAAGGAIDAGRLTVHRGRPITTAWSPTICFDGTGAGEVLLDGRKLVGISQRRTREAARLQCAWHAAYRPEDLLGLLRLGDRPDPSDLAPVATLPAALSPRIVDALVPLLAR